VLSDAKLTAGDPQGALQSAREAVAAAIERGTAVFLPLSYRVLAEALWPMITRAMRPLEKHWRKLGWRCRRPAPERSFPSSNAPPETDTGVSFTLARANDVNRKGTRG
jgi:hypothetical protein